MKHPHYNMIMAKAANTNLVVLTKVAADHWYRQDTTKGEVRFFITGDYFLCHEKHVDTILHILNGGDGQVNCGDGWVECNCGRPTRWGRDWWYMNEAAESRIKPKKEKRWVGVKPVTGVTTRLYESEGECAASIACEYSDCLSWQIIEIEVEV